MTVKWGQAAHMLKFLHKKMPSAMLLSNEIDDNVGYTRSVCKE